MSIKHRHCSIRVDGERSARLKARSVGEKCSVSELVRRAVDAYLTDERQLPASDVRVRRLCEYSQAALDTIISKNFPDTRDAIIAETNSRMAKFHGQ